MNTQIEAVKRALLPIQDAIRKFQTIEKPLTQAECEQAMTDLKALEQALQAVDQSFHHQGNAAGILLKDRFYAMWVTSSYAREQAQEARLQLTSYMPHHKSVARRYLHQRQDVGRMFQAVAKATQELVQAGTVSTTNTTRNQQAQSQPSGGKRPSYLRLVPTIAGEEEV